MIPEVKFETKEIEREPINQKQLFGKIEIALCNLLARRFGNSAKSKLNRYSDRYNMACPICGDSERDGKKKRGNLYTNLTYKCFNCGEFTNAHAFLNKFNSLEAFTIDEVNYIKEVSSKYKGFLLGRKNNIELGIDSDVYKCLVPRKILMKKMGWLEVQQVPRIDNWLINTRKVIKKSVDYQKFAVDPKTQDLVIFNITSDYQRVLSYQVRVDKKPKLGSRYYTYTYSKIIRDTLGIDVDDAMVEDISNYDTLFGMSFINYDLPITLFEGPLDAYAFSSNSIGVAGGSNKVYIENSRYFQDNDKAGLQIAKERINENVPVFMWRKFLIDYKLTAQNIKDFTDLANAVDVDKVDWDRYFTKSIIDYVYV